MMKSPCRYILTFLLIILAAGCSKWNAEDAPAGFALIREHTISAPGNDPPITGTLDFTLIEIDGNPVARETIPPWIDQQRGALVSAGTHQFKAMASPHVRPPDHQPAEVVFTATVKSSKVYYLVGKDGGPVLIEAKSGQR
jgi:hypothetical protein